jgi:hypothetical protein
MKNLYEVFDDFENATSKSERMKVIEKNLSPVLVEVLRLTYHPDFQWYIKEMPDNFKIAQIPAGMSYAKITTELRRLYMFQKGNPTADTLKPRRRDELLLQILENLEPREAEVVIGIFNKDLGVKGLNYKFVKEAFPKLLP